MVQLICGFGMTPCATLRWEYAWTNKHCPRGSVECEVPYVQCLFIVDYVCACVSPLGMQRGREPPCFTPWELEGMRVLAILRLCGCSLSLRCCKSTST